MYGADIDTLEGVSGHAALRFHLGGGLQLRGDAALLRAQMDLNNEEWDGWLWSAEGGLEYGNPIISNTLGEVLDSSSDWDDDEWGEWTDGSVSLGYNVSSGYLPAQSNIGSFIFQFKLAESYDGGGLLELSGAHRSAGGFDSSNMGLRFGGAWISDDEDIIYGIGFATAYSGFEESSFYLLGMDISFAWRMFSQVSFQTIATINGLALTDLASETKENDEVVALSTTMSPVSAFLRWTTPWHIYINGGARADLSGSMPVSYFGEMGYLWGL